MLLSALPPIIANHPHLWVGAAVVVLGLLVYGFRDAVQFSPRRASAISSVCFAESIRRRVLLITPLAMLGVILVSQFQRSIDEQDAIRQTIKFSLFATGMVVTITAIILACTNLPKEIESRVIYTIVTKPTTRLEIVVGKVMGFAKVSLAILALMGLFSFGYLHLRAWSMRSYIAERLDRGAVDSASRGTYEYWRREGLLSSRTFENADELQVFAKLPAPDETRRWFFGYSEGEFVVPFRFNQNADAVPSGAPGARPGEGGLLLQIRLGYEGNAFTRNPEDGQLPVGVAAPSTQFTDDGVPLPKNAAIFLEILDENFQALIDRRQINNGQAIYLTDPSGRTPIFVPITPDVAMNLFRGQTPALFYVNVIGGSMGTIFSADIRHTPDPTANPVCLIVPSADPTVPPRFIGPIDDRTGPTYQPALPTFRGRGGLYGQQIRGGKPQTSPVAQYKFRGPQPQSFQGPGQQQMVAFEMRVGIERGSDESSEIEADATRLELTFVNRGSQQTIGPIIVEPENNRTAYFTVPAEAVQGGNFDLYVRNLSNGHFLGLLQNSVSLVTGQQSFDLNLIKSLGILWMLSILVVIIAIFCSTFVSWPIAIVLTVVLLLGHWAVQQLGASLAPGIGHQVANDIFGTGTNASQARVVSSTVEALSRLLNTLANVLPDIGKFSAIEDIERGITIGTERLLDPLGVLLTFGLPLLVLSYVLFRNKEVAP